MGSPVWGCLLLIELLTQPLALGDTSVSVPMINLNFIHRPELLPDLVRPRTMCWDINNKRARNGEEKGEQKSKVRADDVGRINLPINIKIFTKKRSYRMEIIRIPSKRSNFPASAKAMLHRCHTVCIELVKWIWKWPLIRLGSIKQRWCGPIWAF